MCWSGLQGCKCLPTKSHHMAVERGQHRKWALECFGYPSIGAMARHLFQNYCNRRLQARALPESFRIMHTHITRTGRKDTWSPAYSICMQRCTYSVQCSDMIHFPQLCIKCSVPKSCPGTHTALQAPVYPKTKRIHQTNGFLHSRGIWYPWRCCWPCMVVLPTRFSHAFITNE